MEDILVTGADAWPLGLCRIPLICVYTHPRDYPDGFVARLWDGCMVPTSYISIGRDLEEIRRVIPKHLLCLPRLEEDDPCLVECWVTTGGQYYQT